MNSRAAVSPSDESGIEAWSTMMVEATGSATKVARSERALELGAAIACVVFALALVALATRVPGTHHTFGALMAHRMHALGAALLGGRRTSGPSDEYVLLALAAAAVALWFGSPSLRDRLVIATAACLPAYVLAGMAIHWRIFPSPRAALLAIGTVVAFAAGRRAGSAFLAFAFAVCLTAVAAGQRSPSDIVGGALLGTAMMLVLLRLRGLWHPVVARAMAFAEARPGLSAAFAFVLLTELVQHYHELTVFASLALDTKLFR
jgi:hypothetical protein